MTPTFVTDPVERFRNAVASRMGLHFEDAKLGFLAEVLRRRLEASELSSDVYLDRMETDRSNDELYALAQELTVGETYFFRNIEQFQAFSDIVLPDRMRLKAGRRNLRILSAGCASGEEAYSLAILLKDRPEGSSWDASILAADINPVMIEKAKRARFSSWALRETPADVRQRWFRPDGRDSILDAQVCAAVEFINQNLIEEDVRLWESHAYDVIFCRNVLMYLTLPNARSLMARITRALAPGGYLFLGHAETLRGLSNEFHLRHTHGTFYYQRRGPGESPVVDYVEARAEFWSAGSAPLLTAMDAGATWVDAIGRASKRIEALAQVNTFSLPVGRGNPVADPGAPAWDLGHPFELFRKERFGEALAAVRMLPREATDDPDVLLFQAVLLVHNHQQLEAENVCHQLLRLDEMNTGAHYVLALCFEGSGDVRRAIEHDQVAVYLDPTFAMPRLHLGLLARRSQELEAARREFAQAFVLFQREDPSRLLLFGGGFGREALQALCRAELQACGGKP